MPGYLRPSQPGLVGPPRAAVPLTIVSTPNIVSSQFAIDCSPLVIINSGWCTVNFYL